MRTNLRLGLALAAILFIGPSKSEAAFALQSFTPGSIFSGFSNDETVGWRFTVTAGTPISVTALGWWDQTPGTPLAASHQVGIWTLGGTLVTSATVQTNSTLSGSFRYVNITPVLLAGGTSYVIGGRDLVSDGDNYTTSVGALVTDPRITFNQAAVSPNNSGFAFPGTFSNNSGGRFGPNFQFDSSAQAVPEPASLTLLAVGAAGLAGYAFRRRKAATRAA